MTVATFARSMPRRNVFIGLFGLLLIASCDVPAPEILDPTTPTGAPASFVREIPQNRAVVAFLRGRELSGSANSWRIFIDGTAVADLDIGMRHWQPVPPGPVEIEAQVVATFTNFGLGVAVSEKPTLSLNTKAGQIYILELDPGFAGGPVFKRRDAGALQEAANYIDAPLPAR